MRQTPEEANHWQAVSDVQTQSSMSACHGSFVLQRSWWARMLLEIRRWLTETLSSTSKSRYQGSAFNICSASFHISLLPRKPANFHRMSLQA